MAITKTYDLLNINGVKGWIRDSWARRAIASLQQAVAAIVVPTKTSELTNDSGFITSADIPPGAAASTTTPKMDGTAAVGTENAFARGDHRHPTDTSRQAALNTAQMAAVNSGVTAAKVQEWDSIMVPTRTSELINDSGFITSAPVASVNGQTGVVSLDASDVGALPDSTAIPSKTSDLTNDSGFITASALPSVPSASTANPKMDGTGAAGSSADYARADHVHPHDTSKQDALSAAQMEAVNSGITAAKVAEYDGMVTMFGVPVAIPSGADLNDYLTPGHFSANSGNVASSLVNCPTSVNFTLFVIYRTTAIISQIIIGSSSSIFMRHRTTTSWGSWYKLTGTTV